MQLQIAGGPGQAPRHLEADLAASGRYGLQGGRERERERENKLLCENTIFVPSPKPQTLVDASCARAWSGYAQRPLRQAVGQPESYELIEGLIKFR